MAASPSPVSYSSRVRGSSLQHPWSCWSFLPSARGPLEGSATPGLSCSTCPQPGCGQKPSTVWPRTQDLSLSLHARCGAPHGGQWAVLLPVRDRCVQVKFPSWLGKQKVTVVLQGQGALQTSNTQSRSGHNSRSGGSATLADPPREQGKRGGNNPLAKPG